MSLLLVQQQCLVNVAEYGRPRVRLNRTGQRRIAAGFQGANHVAHPGDRPRNGRHLVCASVAATPDPPQPPSSDIAFTDAVKAMQSRRHSRGRYAKVEARGGFRTGITPDLAEFLTHVDTAYLATANAAGQPYAQHRGGPPGFIRVLDGTTLGFADFVGNRQYVTTGNLSENDRAFLFLMDYANRRRIKLWGRAHVVEADDALVARLMPDGYAARPEQAIVFRVEAWDVNCPQHIPQKFAAVDVAAALKTLEDRPGDAAVEIAAQRAELD